MSQFTQMAGLAFHNFVSAAAGAAVAVALIRGLVRRRSRTLGNFWVDMIRTCIRVLLPLAFVAALIMVSQGTPQNFHASTTGRPPWRGRRSRSPGGPVASQEAIKEGGQNGGGFFGANSAHPFENPNPITNFLQLWLILAIPFAFAFTFGKMARDRKQGWVVVRRHVRPVARPCCWSIASRGAGQPQPHGRGRRPDRRPPCRRAATWRARRSASARSTCGYYAASTTSTSDGAVNCAHDSLTPLGGGVALVNMMFGEVSPGGTGSGLYGMLIFALLAVFIAGLMVGRTPEYLGKKIQAAGDEARRALPAASGGLHPVLRRRRGRDSRPPFGARRTPARTA